MDDELSLEEWQRRAEEAAAEIKHKSPPKRRVDFSDPEKFSPPTEEQVREWRAQGLTRDPRNGRILPGCVVGKLLTPERARELAKQRRERYRRAVETWLGEVMARLDPDVALAKQVNVEELPYEAYGRLVARMAEQVYASDAPRPEAMKEIAYALGARRERGDYDEDERRWQSEEEIAAANILLAALRLAAEGRMKEEVVDGSVRDDSAWLDAGTVSGGGGTGGEDSG